MSNESNNPPDMGLPMEDDVPLPSDVGATAPEVPTLMDQPSGTAPAVETEPTQAGDAAEVKEEIDEVTSNDDLLEEDASRPMEFQRTGANPNAEMAVDPTLPLDPRRPFTDGQGLFLVPCTWREYEAMASNTPRLDPTQSEAGALWEMAASNALRSLPRGDRGVDSLTRDGSLWRQSVRTAGENSAEISAGRPKITDRMGSGPLIGEEATQFLQAMLGTGQVTRIPLYASGIWINMKAPTEQQLLELDRRIANEKITLGRASNGLVFSNSAVYLSSYLANFALSLVFDCSIKNFNLNKLKSRIALPDLPVVLWGLLCTMYPNGYRYYRPCVADPSKCTHVVEALLNITRLLWTDNNALTPAQRQHMMLKTKKFEDSELDNYASQHAYQMNRTIVVKDLDGVKTSIDLRVPTIADHEASGFSWVDGIVSNTDAAFGQQIGGEERDAYITDAARVSSLRQYAHWIERITFDGGRYIEDRATLEELVGQLTGDREVYSKFHLGIKEFIDRSTLSLVAIPYYTCPSCGVGQHTEEEAKNPHLIPIDVQAVFFTLVAQRIQLLLATAGL